MQQDKNENIKKFTTIEDFNKLCSEVHPEPYKEFQRLSILFSSIIKQNGPDSFSTTLVVYNQIKRLVGIVSSRLVQDKQDLYKSMAQMLYFPMSLNSSLFIVAQDAKIHSLSQDSDQSKQPIEALVVTYVTPDDCIVFTVPYTVSNDNDVVFSYENSWISSINEDAKNSGGDMLELFYTFSHSSTSGPFSPHEVLSFLKINNFNFEIINPKNMSTNHVALPLAI